MARKKVFSIFGTRPEAIKMAPVLFRLSEHADVLKSVVCVTAQHRQMLDDVLSVFKIRPDYDLRVMQNRQSLEGVSRRILERLSPILANEKPDLVLVHGDTTTTLIAALAAFYQKIPVAHVEAGLRSRNYQHPYPEEANRRLADALCVLHFAPTPQSRRNLLAEGISGKGDLVTGNTVIDPLFWVLRKKNSVRASGAKHGKKRLILVTVHRRESFGEPLRNIFRALRKIADDFPGVQMVYPVHLNPSVRRAAHQVLSSHPRIRLLEPLNYVDFCRLMQACDLVVTDSGGIQEEAPSLGKPVLVLRRVTERPEAVEAGTARVVGTETAKIYAEIKKLLCDKEHYLRMAHAVNPYGDGKASQRIVRAILKFLKQKKAAG